MNYHMKSTKIYFAAFTLFILGYMIGCESHAYNYNDLVCREVTHYVQGGESIAISCVSEASIEKDKAELKLIKLQIKKLEAESKESKKNE